MMLVEEGKVSLDDRVVNMLPNLPSAWSGVTVRHLLTHTSGVPDWVKLKLDCLVRQVTRDEILKKVIGLPMEFQPGENWSYNQTGPVLLGMIIEKVSGKTVAEFLDERIFKPLGMTSTRFGDSRDVIKNLNPMWYTWENNKLGYIDLSYQTWVYTAAGLNSTVLDLAKFDAALYTERLLKKSSLEQMWTAAKLNDGKTTGYGLGWSVFDLRGHKVVGHAGGRNNWILRFVDDKLTVIVFCNLFRADALSLVMGVAEFYIPSLKQEEKKGR